MARVDQQPTVSADGAGTGLADGVTSTVEEQHAASQPETNEPLTESPGLHHSAVPSLEASDGSTLPVDDVQESDHVGSDDASDSAGHPDVGSVSTGGFDTMLGRLVVSSGLVTQEEVELANNLIKESAGRDEPVTLTDVLLDNDFVTNRQLERIRSEFEAKKSSKSLPGFRIRRKVGAGAMATVFLAEQLSLHRDVAIKILPKKFSTNKNFIERFIKEGRAAAQLNHPNIVQAYDVGKAGEHHYFVMEYVDGPTIYDRLVKEKVLEEAEALDIIRQVALALEHAHERDFIHRDIKPKNIMLTKSGVVKLADLGLARAMSDKDAAKAEAGRAYGTPYYISPEQIRGQLKIGPEADIYGLGATLYHMVTGRVPFEGKNPSEVMHKHLKAELIQPDHLNPKLSNGAAQIIEMMMAKSTRERYQNVQDLMTDLDLVARNQPPHFARRGMLDLQGLSAVGDTGASVDGEPHGEVVRHHHHSSVGDAMSSPLFITMLVLLAISMMLNLVLIAL